MLETASVATTVVKFESPSSGLMTGSSGTPTTTNLSGSSADILNWDMDTSSVLTKYSPVKSESPDHFDNIVLSQTSTDFAELKPLPFDYGDTTIGSTPQTPSTTTNLTGLSDPVLSNNNNNNNNPKVTDLNLRSPGSGRSFYSDVTSSGSNSPPTSSTNPTTNVNPASSSSSSSNPAIKLELDFTASQDAFDDLASIVGISMGADSTVPNLDTADVSGVGPGVQEWTDLDAWIDNIKPLPLSDNFSELVPSSQVSKTSSSSSGVSSSIIANPSMSATQPYLLTTTSLPPSTTGSTLHTLLTQGGPLPPKITQLQPREVGPPQAPPPPYSILQNRLTQGSNGNPKPDYYDSMPSSTSSPSSAATLKMKKNAAAAAAKAARRSTLSAISNSNGSTGNASPNTVLALANGGGPDGGKKMMHHCHICNRGFLNKSNIKVHLRTHTGEKPFKCEHCSKAFRQKAHLLKHMSIHKRISRD